MMYNISVKKNGKLFLFTVNEIENVRDQDVSI